MERATGEAAAPAPFTEGGGWEVFGQVGPAPPEPGAAPEVARIVPRVRATRHKHPSAAGGGERSGGRGRPVFSGGRAPPWRRGRSGTAPLRPPSPCNCQASAPPLLAPSAKGEKGGRLPRRRPRTSPAPLAPPSPPGPPRMGSRLPSCFPRARRGRSRRAGKTGQAETPEAASADGPDVAAGRARSTPSTSSEGDPQSGRAYFSCKARVSFRHQLDSERDSTS